MNDRPYKQDILPYRGEFIKDLETGGKKITIYYPQKVEQASANNLEHPKGTGQHKAVQSENFDLFDLAGDKTSD